MSSDSGVSHFYGTRCRRRSSAFMGVGGYNICRRSCFVDIRIRKHDAATAGQVSAVMKQVHVDPRGIRAPPEAWSLGLIRGISAPIRSTFPWASLSSHAKRHLGRFIRFCRARVFYPPAEVRHSPSLLPLPFPSLFPSSSP